MLCAPVCTLGMPAYCTYACSTHMHTYVCRLYVFNLFLCLVCEYVRTVYSIYVRMCLHTYFNMLSMPMYVHTVHTICIHMSLISDVDVHVACFTCFNSLLSNECSDDVREWISRSVSPTLPEVCMEQLPPNVHPQVIQIAALQLLSSLAKCHARSLL